MLVNQRFLNPNDMLSNQDKDKRLINQDQLFLKNSMLLKEKNLLVHQDNEVKMYDISQSNFINLKMKEVIKKKV